MSNKRGAIIALAIALGFALAGCAGEAFPSNQSRPSATQTSTQTSAHPVVDDMFKALYEVVVFSRNDGNDGIHANTSRSQIDRLIAQYGVTVKAAEPYLNSLREALRDGSQQTQQQTAIEGMIIAGGGIANRYSPDSVIESIWIDYNNFYEDYLAAS